MAVAVSLINLSTPVLQSILSNANEWLAQNDLHFTDSGTALSDLADQSLSFMTSMGGDPKYFAYLAFNRETREIVGVGGFKGAPNELREIEMLIYVFPSFEGRGFGSAIASALLHTAREWSNVQYLTAHTPAQESAATKILEKIGLQRIGEIEDPDDGLLWRWTMLN